MFVQEVQLQLVHSSRIRASWEQILKKYYRHNYFYRYGCHIYIRLTNECVSLTNDHYTFFLNKRMRTLVS